MQVLKFGGSSVAGAEAIWQVGNIIQGRKNEKIVIVVSALGKVTDGLLTCGALAEAGNEEYKTVLQGILQRHLDTAKDLLPVAVQSGLLSKILQNFHDAEDICNGVFMLRELSAKTKDRIAGFGEMISSQIVSAYLHAIELPNEWIDARALIRTDSTFTKASVDFAVTYKNIQEAVAGAQSNLFVCPGFIASDAQNNITTLGRGGSDYTAAIIAGALQASALEIWTDVSGMMTADPRWVKAAKVIPSISYVEAMELSHFGAKVIYPPTLQPVMQAGIPVWVKNTFDPLQEGTIIESIAHHKNGAIRGISSMSHVALLSLEGSGMVGVPGFSRRLFETLAAARINVILITQASSEHSICVGVDEANAVRAKRLIDAAFDYEIARSLVNEVVLENDVAIIALVGDNMKSHAGTSGKMFGALGRNNVNIRAIAQGSSERNISAVIAEADVKKAVNVLHEEFFETTYKQVNLFVAGTGNVGSKLLAQLHQQQDYLQKNMRLQIRVVGIANSRKMLFADEGIRLDQPDILKDAEPMKLDTFIERIQQKNLRNSVFVDVTANETVAGTYLHLFQKSIAVVACNKIACSSSYASYKALKEAAKEHNTSFLFETNVGAGLPVIGTLNDLLRSGDEVSTIQAVLSGTLNFVFNHYDGSRSFASVVRQAQDEGYTEPDPRLDLSGTDVMRKIMILAREVGDEIEMGDITNDPFLPSSCMKGSVDDFYAEMEKHEAHFKGLYDAAIAVGKKLKYVASYKEGKASVGLQHIDASHDFYHLYGKDNIVLLYTARYKDQPMVVKGAGAGAEVTASGVFADVIRAAR